MIDCLDCLVQVKEHRAYVLASWGRLTDTVRPTHMAAQSLSTADSKQNLDGLLKKCPKVGCESCDWKFERVRNGDSRCPKSAKGLFGAERLALAWPV